MSERQRCEPGSPLEGKRLADGGTGYRTIPTIGWLFLLQVITGFALAAAVVVMRSQLAAAAGAGFALATLGGYPLSIRTGLFGFKEVATGLLRAGRTLAIRPAPRHLTRDQGPCRPGRIVLAFPAPGER